MDENHNKPKQHDSEGIGFIQKPGMGSRSYTVAETKTISYINSELLIKRINGEPLELKNSDKWRYFLLEDGTLFKYNTETLMFYQFNLETMMWNGNQYLATVFYDTFLRPQELLSFKDYYDTENEQDLNSGRRL